MSSVRTSISKLALASFLGAVAVSASPAFAGGIKSISVDKIVTNFDEQPTLEMKDSGSGYVFHSVNTVNIKFRLRAEGTAGTVMFPAEAHLNGRQVYGLPLHYQPHELDVVVNAQVTPADMQSFHASATSLCNLGGKVGTTTKSMFQIPLVFEASPSLSGDSKQDMTTYQGTIVCGPRRPPQGPQGMAHEQGQMRVRGLQLFLSTFSHATSQPNPGTVCKKGRVLVRVEASKIGAVRFKLHTKIGNQPVQAQGIDAWAQHDGNGKFFAEYTKWVSVDKTTPIQAMVEDLVNPVGASSGWKSLTLHCTGAGGGGLVSQQNDANPDNKLPGKPKQPKRTIEDGPSKLKTGAKPTLGKAQAAAKGVFIRSKPHVN